MAAAAAAQTRCVEAESDNVSRLGESDSDSKMVPPSRRRTKQRASYSRASLVCFSKTQEEESCRSAVDTDRLH